MASAFLEDRGVVRVTGEDARGFLDGLVTSDMDKVAVDRARHAALLTPQGKILFDFIVAEADGEQGGGFYLDVPRALAADLARRLGFYKLRARVSIEDLSETAGVVAFWDGERADEGLGVVYADPRLPELGDRVIAPRSTCPDLASEPAEAWHAHRVALGVPEGGRDFAYGDAFPHEADMDQLGGVDFDKGCYVGQEVVSRMQHRGTARTRIVPVRFRGGVGAGEGAEAHAGGRAAGRIGSVTADGRALAMLRLDRVEDALASGGALEADGLAFDLVKPAFARFPWPGEGGGA
ncbi:folate-binding protein [Alsobacter sp. SYSU M60028]|uniref:Folate-binding protein n=1 Tax=Alsobacter ponti TaxID=2962936 RepID=A0ABT1LC34_9HYPH|nr:folate-binding protein [Alsobacter ponti]MCP8939057.1 folate-binding protein [Alsobacter ponti]